MWAVLAHSVSRLAVVYAPPPPPPHPLPSPLFPLLFLSSSHPHSLLSSSPTSTRPHLHALYDDISRPFNLSRYLIPRSVRKLKKLPFKDVQVGSNALLMLQQCSTSTPLVLYGIITPACCLLFDCHILPSALPPPALASTDDHISCPHLINFRRKISTWMLWGP
jgi:hypothetical protein